jgi:hypothetical protein
MNIAVDATIFFTFGATFAKTLKKFRFTPAPGLRPHTNALMSKGHSHHITIFVIKPQFLAIACASSFRPPPTQ